MVEMTVDLKLTPDLIHDIFTHDFGLGESFKGQN